MSKVARRVDGMGVAVSYAAAARPGQSESRGSASGVNNDDLR